MELNRLFDLVEEIRDNATVEATFGPPAQVGEKTIIPIGRVAYGFGLGFAQSTESTAETTDSSDTPNSIENDVASGGSGGLSVRPLAILEVTPETTTLKPIVDNEKIAKMGMCVGAWIVFWLARALLKIFGPKG